LCDMATPLTGISLLPVPTVSIGFMAQSGACLLVNERG
jgi:hypothetical protein